MVKIKKYVYKLLTVVLAFLVVFNMSAVGVLAEGENSNAVTPEAEDYSISGGTITGLKSTYLSKLTEEQKQNIRLVIPEKIDGEKVTAIGKQAFEVFYGALISKRYEGCSFISLDLSQAKYLKEIGDDAFYDCKITGNLTFPDSLTSIGKNAFRQTEGFEGISGTLKFPENIESIGEVAFSNQKGLKGIDLSECTGLQTLPTSVFRYTGLEGVVILPDNLQEIGGNCFASTKISTIYLPKRKVSTNSTFINSSSFASNNSLKDIICADLEDYNFVANAVTSNRNAVTFPVTVTLYKQNVDPLEKHSTMKRLYNKPYNYIMNEDKSWEVDENYKFPLILNEDKSEKIWVNAKAALLPIKEDNKVQSYSLYSIKKVIEDPTIVYGPDVDQEYNGQSPVLTVDTSHPLKKSTSEAQKGDALFYYSWNWSTINSTPAAQTGYNDAKSKYSIGADVRAPYAITCYVTVKGYIMTGHNDSGNITAIQFYEDTHQFIVDLRPADPVLNPTPSSGTYKMTEGETTLPDIKLSDDDTPGTITWDANQTLHEGLGSYQWTFKPNKNKHNSENYETVKGSTELYCTTEEFNNSTIKDKIDQLGDIPESGEVADSGKQAEILDAFAAYELADDDIQMQVSEEQKDKIFAAIEKLPQIQIGAEGLNLGNEKDLLKNLTAKDAAAAKEANKNISIKVVSKEADPEPAVESAINQVAGSDAKVGAHLDVKVLKTVTDGTLSSEEILTQVKKPLKLVFDVPETLWNANRKFFIIRAHSDEAGNTVAEKLIDEDTEPSTITVESDKFSTYAIAYTEETAPDISGPSTGVLYYDITASAGEHGTISPADKVSVVYGGNKTFSFQPETGYKVGDVLVDGVSVGSPSSYTFENVKAAHSIQVLFTAADSRLITGVENTTLKLTSKVGKGYIRLSWKKSPGYKVDYYQVYKSTKKNSGYGSKAYYTTKNGVKTFYKNTKGLKKGTRYYYKARGVRLINNQKYYIKWSNKTWRIAK